MSRDDEWRRKGETSSYNTNVYLVLSFSGAKGDCSDQPCMNLQLDQNHINASIYNPSPRDM